MPRPAAVAVAEAVAAAVAVVVAAAAAVAATVAVVAAVAEAVAVAAAAAVVAAAVVAAPAAVADVFSCQLSECPYKMVVPSLEHKASRDQVVCALLSASFFLQFASF